MSTPITGEAPLWGTHVELPGGANALFTTRAQGNLSTVTGPERARGADMRERLRGGLGLAGLCMARQVHGTVVRHLRADYDGALQSLSCDGAVAIAPDGTAEADGDGHATALRGVAVMVLVADCLPVVLAAEGAVAAVHAGWRGLAGGVLDAGVSALRSLTDSDVEIVAVIGPGAGACCYEVGPEVHEALGSPQPPSRLLDLRARACERLARLGVARVEHVELCTICDPGCFSHRRAGDQAGRQAGLAWLS